MGLQGHFSNKFLSLQMTLPIEITRIKRNPLLNIYDQQLNNPICEKIDERENDKEENIMTKEKHFI